MSKIDEPQILTWRCDLYTDATLQQACLTAFALAPGAEQACAMILAEIKPIQVRLYPGEVVPAVGVPIAGMSGRGVRMSRYAGAPS
jgi:hypothetical protein